MELLEGNVKANKAFECVCNLISEKYLDNGWKYSKSGHWMSKKIKISFIRYSFIQVGIIYLIKRSILW